MNSHMVCKRARKIAGATAINIWLSAALTLFLLIAGNVHAIDSTITVKRLTGRDGSFHIQYAVNGHIGSADIPVEQGDDRHAVAQKIANAIGNGAKAVGNTVTFEPGFGGGGSVDVNDIAVTEGNNDIFPACGLHAVCPSAGTLFFGPNPFNGQANLVTDTVVTA